jgi:hypothetical protein
MLLGVIINWKRPENVHRILPRMKTLCEHTVVMHNAPCLAPPFDAGDVWTVGENLGCPVRWLPALMLHRFRYVAFFDDDCMPKSVPIWLADEHSVVGQCGRKLKDGKYVYGDVKAPGYCDIVVRNCVFRRELVLEALKLRDALAPKVGKLVDVHDDIMLNCAAQMATNRKSIATPHVIESDMPTGVESLHRRPGHKDERQRMIDACKELGWKSLCG